MCRRVGHQIKDCEDAADKDEDCYPEIDEKDQAFWTMVASFPPPKGSMMRSRRRLAQVRVAKLYSLLVVIARVCPLRSEEAMMLK